MKIAAGVFIFLLISVQICNAQEYHGAYMEFYFFHKPSTSTEGTGKIYLNSNKDAFSSLYNPALPSYSDNLKISYSNSQKAFLHVNAFYNAFGVDVPVKKIGTFSLVRNFTSIEDDFVDFPIKRRYLSYSLNYSRDVFKGFFLGIGANYFKWEYQPPSNYPSNYYFPQPDFSEYYSFNLGVSYNYTLPESEYYSQNAFINFSILNIPTSHSPLPQIDRVSLGYISKYKGFGIIKGMDDFQTDIQIEEVDLLNSYYYNTFSLGAEIKFLEIISLRAGNYFFAVDYMTFGLGLSLPLKLLTKIPLVIGFDYSHLKAPVFYYQGYKIFDSFAMNVSYDIN